MFKWFLGKDLFLLRWHGKRWSSSKQRFVTSRWVFFVRRWAMARSKATDEYIPNLTPKKFFCMWITRKSEGEWRHRGDVGSAYTPQKTVLRHWEFCCSYRDKRWRVGKPMVSRTQIWPQKNFLSSGFGDNWGWSDVTTGSKLYHHTSFSCFVKLCRTAFNTGTSDGALESW